MNFFQDLKQKLEKGMETAGQKSQRMLEISRLSLKIKGKKDDIERMIQKLGREVYEAWEPAKKLEMTDQIEATLTAIHDLNEQLKSLQKELEDLKNSDITVHDTAEKVSIPPSVQEEEPSSGKVEVLLPDQESPRTRVKTVQPGAAVLYICPFCAHQVKNDASSCSHCGQRFY
ncbi:hypothetical protein [Lihuaxuella thermophila]|uniref:Zinc ribbon domain-containing protein n=1 Tax=Lihuaxuella thermophila TaxID=1173111 RepID=A0A1H8AP99_9BACL|nr:hypothetical protein [Lihuaxuella thermophila]SEM71609.1 hypothetical protein SAMN05444955_101228 [Lihuaxuella thermophila]